MKEIPRKRKVRYLKKEHCSMMEAMKQPMKKLMKHWTPMAH
jgi:hypothetical protein